MDNQSSTVQESKENRRRGLSIYHEKDLVQRYPLSNVLIANNTEAYKKENMDNVQNIKDRFAKYKVNVGMNQLLRAMVPPDKNLPNDG